MFFWSERKRLFSMSQSGWVIPYRSSRSECRSQLERSVKILPLFGEFLQHCKPDSQQLNCAYMHLLSMVFSAEQLGLPLTAGAEPVFCLRLWSALSREWNLLFLKFQRKITQRHLTFQAKQINKQTIVAAFFSSQVF